MPDELRCLRSANNLAQLVWFVVAPPENLALTFTFVTPAGTINLLFTVSVTPPLGNVSTSTEFQFTVTQEVPKENAEFLFITAWIGEGE